MQHKFIKTAIAMAISAMSCASMAVTLGTVSIDGKIVTEGVEEALKNASNTTVEFSGDESVILKSDGENKDLTILGSNISISSSGEKFDTISWIRAGDLIIGDTNTDTITFKNSASTSGFASIFIRNDTNNETPNDGIAPSVTVTGKNVLIDSPNSVGIWVQNNTQANPNSGDSAKVTVKAENTTIKASTGIIAFSNSQVTINSNLTIDATNAIDTRGNSIVNINTDGKHSTVLNGDIVFETPATPEDSQNSGNLINSHVTVGLHGEGSSWTGRAYQTYQVKEGDDKVGVETVALDNGEAFFGNVEDFKLDITNGAKWNMTGDSFVNGIDVADGGSVNMQADAKVLNVDAMNVDNATVSMQGGADQKVSVNTLKSKAATLNMNASTKDGKSVETGKFEVLQSVEDGSDLDVQLSGITADDIEDPKAAMDSVKDSVVAKGATIDKTIAEGDVNGAITETTAADGTRATVKVAENTKLASMKGVNAAALVAWRDEVAYTNQRMEFLRDHEHAYGAWGQVYGGESTYEGKVDLKTTTVQVGADAAVGDWVVGAAFSYMNGDADMHNGNADTDAYTVSLYTSRMFDSGLFVNGLARYGRLSTDATAGNMDADYDNDAFSIGGNVGYRINFTNQAFVEPSFGLQYAYVKGDDYTAGNGVKVEQDDFDALIASLGARAGFNFPNDSGRLFARASVNHDFMGEIDGTASKGTLADSMYVDLGGTWFTYGVGAQFDVTKNLSFWGNIDRTTGGEVSTNYMMNAGLRYVF